MQKTFVKIISKKILTTAFITGTASLPANAASEKYMEIVSPTVYSAVEFTGAADNLFFFTIKIDNPTDESITVEVRNDDGEVLYFKKCTGKTIVKKVSLENELLTAHFNFTIKPEDKEATEIFVVSITTKPIEAVVTA